MKKVLEILVAFFVLVGCSSTPAKQKEVTVNLQSLLSEITEQYIDTYTKSIDTLEFVENLDISIDSISQLDYITAFLDVRSDEICMIRLTSEENVETVKEYLTDRKYDIVEEFENYIPSEAEKAENGIVFAQGTYVFLIIHENAEAIKQDILKALGVEEEQNL